MHVCSAETTPWLILEHVDGGELRIAAFEIQYMLETKAGTQIGVTIGPGNAPLTFCVKESPSDIATRVQLLADKLRKKRAEEMRDLENGVGGAGVQYFKPRSPPKH